MRRAVARCLPWLSWLVAPLGGGAGCASGELPPSQVTLSLLGGHALGGGPPKSVAVLVFAGPTAGCQRVLHGPGPLADDELELVAHVFFKLDEEGAPFSAPHVRVPPERLLAFYAESYAGSEAPLVRTARGCAEVTLSAGPRAVPVSITLAGD